MFSLSDREAAVYRALLRHQLASAAELARSARTSPAVARRAIATLLDCGLAVADSSAACGARPLRPDAARAEHLRELQEQAVRQASALETARADTATALEDYLAGCALRRPVAEIERIDGLAAIRARMDEIVTGAQHELLSIITEFDDDQDAVDAARDEDAAILARGLRVRTIYPASIRDMPITWAYAAETAAAGEEIRLGEQVSTRLLVIDRSVAVMPADADDIEAGAVVVRCAPVIATLVALFELAWARATPAFSAAADVSGRDEALLSLLAAGAKDESTARHLGCNVRTARRDIARLMADLGAATRFQAGVEAARRGWV